MPQMLLTPSTSMTGELDNWRVVTIKPTNNSDQESHQQKQYHVYFAPMTIENRALPIFEKAGFTP